MFSKMSFLEVLLSCILFVSFISNCYIMLSIITAFTFIKISLHILLVLQ